MTDLYPNTRLAIHAIFGALLGGFTACVFLILYYGTKYDIPIPDEIRFKAAFWETILLVIVIVVILFYRDIITLLKDLSVTFEGSDEIE